MSAPILDAELFFPCQNVLGEGIFWDTKTNLLHWVDIDKAELHSLDPRTMKYSVDTYPESRHLSFVAPRTTEPGFIGTLSHSVVLLPPATTPVSNQVVQVPNVKKSLATLFAPIEDDTKQLIRFNDGACDSHGRMFAGSMTLPEAQHGPKRGKLWKVEENGEHAELLSSIGTSNGIGWSPDDKVMYYIDSAEDVINAFDFDLVKGELSNRRVFVTAPPSIEDHETQGVFDGLTVDGNGNVWAARWKDSRVIGYSPAGELIVHIRTPGCKSPTIPCFGGENLTTMYIASAHSKLANQGDIQQQFPNSGDLFKIECGPGTPLGKLLGAQWCGRVRGTFGA